MYLKIYLAYINNPYKTKKFLAFIKYKYYMLIKHKTGKHNA